MHYQICSLKKVAKIFLRILQGLSLLVWLLWILVETNSFQNYLVARLTHTLSRDLGTQVSIKHADFELFDNVSLEGALIRDHQNDTLLYAGKARIRITDWFFLKNSVRIHYVGLDDAVVNLNRKDSVWNYQFLADYLGGNSPTDTTQSPVALSLGHLELNHVKLVQRDQWVGQDFLASVNRLNFSADTFDLTKNIIDIRNLDLDHPVYAEYDYPGNKPQDTTSAPAEAEVTPGLQWNSQNWKVRVGRLSIHDGGISVENQTNEPSVDGQFDPNRIVLSSLNGTLQHLTFLEDTVRAVVDLSVRDRGGFEIKKLTSDFKFTPREMEFRQLDIVTNHSHITHYYSMKYRNFNDDMNDFIHSVRLEGHFNDCSISSDDIAYFAPDIANWHEQFQLSGDARGTIDDLDGKNIVIKGKGNNLLQGEITLRGLPDMNQTFIDFRSQQLRTNYAELARLVPGLKTINNPNLAVFGNINFTGSFTGYLRDFVTYGTLETNIGSLNLDLQMKVPPAGKPLYNGTVNTSSFEVGDFIGNTHLGKIAFDGKIKGKGFSTDDVDIDIDGNISKLFFNGYNYSNIIAHGKFVRKQFTGTASIDDPNLKIDTLNGRINFSKKDLQLR
ncbi:MAG: hypothetical protein KGM98_13870, partial [Bacteroidota bacterium]|nr:hypothetical protein [Bacteroidota bacterium]